MLEFNFSSFGVATGGGGGRTRVSNNLTKNNTKHKGNIFEKYILRVPPSPITPNHAVRPLYIPLVSGVAG